jgi:chromosome segregation protein
MRIRQLELIGFKSFADRTVISLHDGITCIVGPNGCGKSNIVDSFRWVLGEQSAKSLRGEKMEEVIFQGTATKKLRGMAEVTLLLSHSFGRSHADAPADGNGDTPDDDSSDKITVSRRLYRSGESEYILNKRQCRLKDIRDIFLDTGLDVKSYSILDQGKISEILNAKPHERRFLIEEVAGVMKYKVRKAEAVSKLESSKQNLQRITDIVAEVKRQMNSLDRQVKKAERYKRLAGELKEVELRSARRNYTELSEMLASLGSETERLREADTAKRAELSAVETAIETRRLELLEREKRLLTMEATLQDKTQMIADGEKRGAVVRTQMESRKADIVRLTSQREEADSRKEELSRKTTELTATEQALTSEMESLSGELRDKEDLLSSLEASVAGKEEVLEDTRKDLFSVSEAMSHKKNEAHKLQSSLDTLAYRESVAVRDLASVREGAESLEGAIGESAQQVSTKTEELRKLQGEADALKLSISSARIEIETKRRSLSSEREALASNLSRLSSLRELIVDASLMDYLAQAAGKDAIPRVTLSDVVGTESGFEVAIEAALSEKVNSLIIEKREDLFAVTDIIREKNLPRTALLFAPLYTAAQRRSAAPLPPGPQIIGRADDFVIFDESGTGTEAVADLREMISSSLRTICVVETLQAALDLLTESPSPDLTLVTLGGEVITGDGFILAGKGKEILKRKREIKALQNSIRGQQRAIADLEQELTGLAGAVSSDREILRGMEASMVDLEKGLSLLDHALQDQREEMERKRRKQRSLDDELSAISLERQSLAALLQSKTAEAAGLEEERNRISNEITRLQQDLAESRSGYEEARGRFTDMKLAVGACREKIEALRKERESVAGLIEDAEQRKTAAVKEIEEARLRIEESQQELRDLEYRLKDLVAGAGDLKAAREREKEEIAEANESLLAQGGSLKKMRAEIDLVSQRLGEMNTRTVELQLRLEGTTRAIREKYDLDIAACEVPTEGFDPAEDEGRVAELQGKMRDLGPVNLGSLEEYEELKGRYDFLSKQQEDLTLSIAELEEAITRINATTRRKLREAYEALRAKFTEVFRTLFGGGTADIVLTDTENILESGLDIIAQPPGKKLQNMNLLSGGEKALTSLALLFAGFLIKPSPLCILDEADAPLDESNTVRFADMVKNLSRDTQFIVVTHNKTTMEVANYLYGVTMEEAGVSKIISLQFSET